MVARPSHGWLGPPPEPRRPARRPSHLCTSGHGGGAEPFRLAAQHGTVPTRGVVRSTGLCPPSERMADGAGDWGVFGRTLRAAIAAVPVPRLGRAPVRPPIMVLCRQHHVLGAGVREERGPPENARDAAMSRREESRGQDRIWPKEISQVLGRVLECLEEEVLKGCVYSVGSKSSALKSGAKSGSARGRRPGLLYKVRSSSLCRSLELSESF